MCSYTTFSLGNLRLAQDKIGTDGSLVATAEITNTGQRAGEEVVQLYVGARSSKVDRAPKELKAFTNLSLAPGETCTVRLAVPVADLAYHDTARAGSSSRASMTPSSAGIRWMIEHCERAL